MPDELKIIERIISEHQNIRSHVKLAGDSVNDIEAIFNLHKAQAGWHQTSLAGLIEKEDKLLQATNFLEEGLKTHFAYEEKVLPPLFGKLLMDAVVFRHREIARHISAIKVTLAMNLQGNASAQQVMARRNEIQQRVNDLVQAVEEHAFQEETIFGILQKGLEASHSERRNNNGHRAK